MVTRDTVRDYQRRIAHHDRAHAKAVQRLEAVQARRAAVVAEQDRRVGEAEAELEAGIATMVTEIGVELTASLLGRELVEVRRLARRGRRRDETPDPAGS